MYDENSSEIARAEISSTTEEITSIEGKDHRKEAKRASRRISGFTGAPNDANEMMQQEIQTLLQSAKADAKNKGDIFQKIRGNDSNPNGRQPRKSLFGSTFTPKNTRNGNPSLDEVSPGFVGGGYTRGFPWANDLAKIHIPKLTKTNPDAIIDFQRKYREYLRAVHELEERYSSKIPVRTVYSCIAPRTLHYLCYMTDLIPEDAKDDPQSIDRGVIHQVIMNFMPIDSTDFTMQLDEELNKIQIKLWPNGLQSIEEAWNKLFDLDIKYKSIQLKPKKTIRILASNILPKETSRMLITSMSTGTPQDQAMASNLMLFHKRLVQISKAAKLVFSMGLTSSGRIGSAYSARGQGKPLRRSKAAITEGGCKWHGPHSPHGTSECYIEHPERAPRQPFNVEKAKQNAKKLRKLYTKRHQETTEAQANVIVPKVKEVEKREGKATKVEDSNSSSEITQHREMEYPGIPRNEYMPSCFYSSSGRVCIDTPMDSQREKDCTHDQVHGKFTVRMKIPTRTRGKSSIHVYDLNRKESEYDIIPYGQKQCNHGFYPTKTKEIDNKDMIWDSGASHSIISNVLALSDTTSPPFKKIKGLSGNVSHVVAAGSLNNVDGVLAVPESTQDILSVGSFLDQKGGKITFTSNAVFYKPSHPTTMAPTKIGERREDGLYNASGAALHIKSPAINLSRAEQDFQLLRERVHMLHRILGHVGKPKMKSVVAKHHLMGLKPHHVDLLTYCEACKVGSAKFKPKNRISDNKAKRFGERLMSDNSGKLRVKSTNGSQYACVIVDEYSSWVWIKGLKSTSETYHFVRHVIQVELHQRNDHAVKFFRSDNGTEYINTAMNTLLANHGIVRERTCPASSSQNGKAERTIGILFAMMRKALYEARLPPSFWLEALQWAVYTYNRIPLSHRKDGKSPYDLRYNKQPSVSNLRAFGVRGSVTLTAPNRAGKHMPTGHPCILVGYGYVDGQKGYRLYIPSKRVVITSLNAQFDTIYNSVAYRKQGDPALYMDDNQRHAINQMFKNSEVANSQRPHIQPRSHEVPIEGDDDTSNNIPESTTNNSVRKSPVLSPKQRLTPHEAESNDVENDDQLVEIPVQETLHENDVNDERPITPTIPLDAADTDKNEMQTNKKFQVVDPSKPLPRGWVAIDEDHPYLNRDEEGRPKDTTEKATGDSIAERVRNRKARLKTNEHPDFMGGVVYTTSKTKDLVSDHVTPKHYGQAMRCADSDKWKEAIRQELQSIKNMGCYKVIDEKDLPKGANVIGYQWVFKIKKNGDGTVSRYKARICVNGSKQKYGIDYLEVFSPVANQVTIRLILAIAVHHDLEILQFDIKLAFVSSKIDRPVYMKIPSGAKQEPGKIWQLLMSLYGLKQAPRLFNAHLNTVLTTMGFTRSKYDPCLYIFKKSKTYTLLVIVVDDILLATNDVQHAKHFEREMKKVFDLKSMGTPKYMIGMNLSRSKNKLHISQKEYIRDLAHRFEVTNDKPTRLPASSAVRLVATGISGQSESPPINEKSYRSLVGALMYAILTRPDVATSVSMSARFLQAPRQAHMKFALKILSYLHTTKDLSLVFTKTKQPKLICYADSSFADDAETCRSRYGFLIFYGNALISWKSKLGAGVKLSTAEAEYVCAMHASKEIMWLKNVLRELHLENKEAVIIHEDNQACIKMAENPIVNGRNKHMCTKMHYIRERVQEKDVKLVYIPTKQQMADILTKNLPSHLFVNLRDNLLDPGLHIPLGMH